MFYSLLYVYGKNKQKKSRGDDVNHKVGCVPFWSPHDNKTQLIYKKMQKKKKNSQPHDLVCLYNFFCFISSWWPLKQIQLNIKKNKCFIDRTVKRSTARSYFDHSI